MNAPAPVPAPPRPSALAAALDRWVRMAGGAYSPAAVLRRAREVGLPILRGGHPVNSDGLLYGIDPRDGRHTLTPPNPSAVEAARRWIRENMTRRKVRRTGVNPLVSPADGTATRSQSWLTYAAADVAHAPEPVRLVLGAWLVALDMEGFTGPLAPGADDVLVTARWRPGRSPEERREAELKRERRALDRELRALRRAGREQRRERKAVSPA